MLYKIFLSYILLVLVSFTGLVFAQQASPVDSTAQTTTATDSSNNNQENSCCQ